MRRLAPHRLLLTILVLDLLLQFFGLWRSIDPNPALLAPAGDALEYWEWGGRIAEGELISDKPFMSAPLYPYFVGVVRSLGGGMLILFVVQLVLRSLTAWMLARISSRLFGHAGFGLATAILFLWLEEPAYYSMRILNSSLQLFTVALLLEMVVRHREASLDPDGETSTRLLWAIGASLGLATLANPALLIAIPFFAWWLGLRPPQLRGTGIAIATCLVVIAPATWHNYLASSKWPAGGEFIPISAQAGVTFAHGNSAGAMGTYKPIEGVSQNRSKQNDDAYRLAKSAGHYGDKEGWNYTSSFFRKQGSDYLLNNVGAALVLELRKLRWFFCGRNYGDLYNITLEDEDPDWPRQVPLPGGLLQLGWILPGAFVGLWFLIRRDKRQAIPIATLLVAVLFVVMVFWYSPRYRLPAAPLAALLAPYGVFALAAAIGRHKSWQLMAVFAVLPGLLLEGWSSVSGFDSKDDSRPQYEYSAGLNFLHQEEFEAALPRLETALGLGFENAEIHHGIAQAQVKIATAFDLRQEYPKADALYTKAIVHYQQALEINSTRLDTWFSLVSVLDYMKRSDEALEAVERALDEAAKQEPSAIVDRLQQMRAKLRNGR